jgi:hypothetical protein
MLNQSQIDENIAWLLANGSAPVRYLTHKQLLKTPSGPEIAALWREVLDCPDALEIFSKQKDDGSWFSGGRWAEKPPYTQKSKPGGYDPESPKYVTAVWILPLLGEMGFTVEDERVREGAEYILNWRVEKVDFSYRVFNDPAFAADYGEFSPCWLGKWLHALVKVGLKEDPRVRRGYAILAGAQREDGGWVFPVHYRERGWTRSCPFSSANATLALYDAGFPEYQDALRRALAFQLWHLSTKEPVEIQRFFYHGHQTLQELIMFTELRVGLEEQAVQAQLKWLMSMYCQGEGRFHYTGKPVSKFSFRADAMEPRIARYRLYHLVEDDWLTYYATRIAVYLDAALHGCSQ